MKAINRFFNRLKCLHLLLVLAIPSLSCAAIPENLEVIQVATAEQPVAFVSAHDGSGRMFIVEKQGIIKVFDDGVVLEEPFLDISSEVNTQNEWGLLGLAFDPEYSENGVFYINYNKERDFPEPRGNTVIASYSVGVDPNKADPESQQLITEIEFEFSYHIGGHIAFGPDGYLYIAIGDGGRSGSQAIDHALGKMLRIAVDRDILFISGLDQTPDCGLPRNYKIPANNPHVDDQSACAAVYLNGMRNPWRWSFDRMTGDIFIGDVGANAREVISLIEWGEISGNLGWPCQEGDLVTSQECISNIDDLIEPIFSYPHKDGGYSVVGGYMYRGSAIPDLRGTYLFNDIYSGAYFFAEKTAQGWVSELWANETLSGIVSYGEDEQGELYYVSYSGPIYKLVQR